jgi:hypothetical protein
MNRPLPKIVEEIEKDWQKVNYAAVPYLKAMECLESIKDNYYCDTGRAIVSYFLANASSWHGETAKRIKKELRMMVDGSYKEEKR